MQTCAYCVVHNPVSSIHPNPLVSYVLQTRNYLSLPLIPRPRSQRNPASKSRAIRETLHLPSALSSRPRQKARVFGGSCHGRVSKRAHKTKDSGHVSLTYAGEQDENIGRSHQHGIHLSNSPVKKSNATRNNGRYTKSTLNTIVSCTLGPNAPPSLGSNYQTETPRQQIPTRPNGRAGHLRRRANRLYRRKLGLVPQMNWLKLTPIQTRSRSKK